MSLLNIFQVAGSGMNAQNVRLNTTASNIANADSVSGSADQAYKARHPVFSTVLSKQMDLDRRSAGVKVEDIVLSQAEHMKRYEPDSPFADEQGYVYQSNVNVIEEMTNMMTASRNYENNVEMLNTAKQLMIRTLQLGQ